MNAQLTCNSCRQRADLGTMKYSKDGAGLICESCWTKQTKGAVLKIPKTEQPIRQKERGQKVKFFCRSCSYNYERAIDFRGPKLCPNCGKDTVVYNLPNKAEDLLKELDRMDEV